MTGEVPILCYHGVGTAAGRYEQSFTVEPARLAAHLDVIAAKGLRTITVGELARGRREATALGRCVALTFDDGYADLVRTVSPLLAERQMVATAFVTSGNVEAASTQPPGSAVWLTWTELNELARGPMVIGAHGHDHLPLDVVSLGAAQRDLRRCKDTLEQHLGASVDSIAYPYGHSTAAVRDYVRDLGFTSGCGVRHAISGPNDDLHDLARLLVRRRTGPERLAQWLDGQGVRVAPCAERMRTRAARPLRRLRVRISG